MSFALFSVLFSTVASAEVEYYCDPPIVFFTSPSNQQSNVPIDVQPIVGMSDGCETSTRYELSILLEGEVIHSNTIEWQNEDLNLLTITPDANLEPNTLYELKVQGIDGSGEETITSFTTGDGQVEGISGVPSGTVDEALIYDREYSNRAIVRFYADPVNDSDDLSVMMVYNEQDPDTPVWAFPASESNALQGARWSIGEPFPDELCLQATQRDGKGQLSDLSEPFCGVVEIIQDAEIDSGEDSIKDSDACGCASSTGVAWFSPLLAMVAIRRREKNLERQ